MRTVGGRKLWRVCRTASDGTRTIVQHTWTVWGARRWLRRAETASRLMGRLSDRHHIEADLPYL